jgi:hypothetical protein
MSSEFWYLDILILFFETKVTRLRLEPFRLTITIKAVCLVLCLNSSFNYYKSNSIESK